MRVAVYYRNDDVRLEQRPLPEIHDGELLVKIMSSGICGTDVMEWYRIKKAPRVLGHEIGGVIERVGKGVDGFRKGDRVVLTHHVPCNDCVYCQRGQHTLCATLHSTGYDPGGFSEYVRVPAINLQKRGVLHLPDSVSFDEATFVEPLGCVVRGLRTIGFSPARTVLVLGSGISGTLMIKTLKAFGAGRILATDVIPSRLEAASAAGADVTIDAQNDDVVARVREETDGEGADFVITTAGAPAVFTQAVELVRKGGRVLLYGIAAPGTKVEFDVYAFWEKQAELHSTYAAAPRDLAEALTLLESKRVLVTDLITHHLPLEQTQLGFQLTITPDASMKVIVCPQE